MNDDQLAAAIVAADPAKGPVSGISTQFLVAEAMRRARPERTTTHGRRLTTRWGVIAAVAVAAATVVAVSIVGLRTAPSAQAAISLVPFTASPTAWVLPEPPAGLSGPAFSGDTDGTLTTYVAAAPSPDQVGISSTPQVRPELADDVAAGTGQEVAVAGTTGWVYRQQAQGDVRSAVYVSWKSRGGQWTEIGGEGAYADTATLVGLADSMLPAAADVLPFDIGVAPEGWHVAAYRRIASTALPAQTRNDPSTALGLVALAPAGQDVTSPSTVSIVEYATTDSSFPAGRGRGTSEKVVSAGRSGILLHNSDGWALQVQLAAGRSVVFLFPSQFTRTQALTMSAAVTSA